MLIDRGNNFYNNRFMKSWLKNNGIEMYSPQNEGEFFVVKNLLEPKKI